MLKPTVFLSYSHQDKVWKDRLSRQLRVLGELEVWDDRRIAVGTEWYLAIEEAVERARVAILLISAEFLTSKFILGEEVPRLLRRRQTDGLVVLPVIVRPCAWQAVEWLSRLQCFPKDGRALSRASKAEADQEFAMLALELRKILGKTLSPRSPDSAAVGPDLALGRLPVTSPVFVGREAELARLDAAWAEPGIHVLALVAFGGVGKSALVARWLDRLAVAGWPGVERAFDWSFYSQRTGERVTSSEPFFAEALRFFGDPEPQAGSLHDRGVRLAGLIRQRRTLLVLDGVEPLQYPPGPLAGKLKDAGLAALLKGLAASNPGLCVVTTRERIADLNGFAQQAPQVELEVLGVKEGVKLLKQLGVEGREKELRAAVEEFGGHALTLSLLGSYLKRAHGGDVRKRREVDLGKASERQGGHAFRLIEAYAAWLGDGVELAVLRLLGLFDRPANGKALTALRASPAIPGLTEPLVGLTEEDWRFAVASLREHGLLKAGEGKDGDRLDTHRLVRAYFAEELATRRPEAWREGNLRLYEHLYRATPELPDTLEEMQPLFAAVVHGCRAGLVQEALEEVYWQRIQRGSELYSTRKLGALGSELTALAEFFERPWSQPSARLTAADQSFVLNEAAFVLRALGRLVEAVEPMQSGLDRRIAQADWRNAAISAGNLSELTLTMGEVARAVELGRLSVELADRSGDAFHRIGNRTTWADALHQAGRRQESAAAFREAETLQAERQPEYPRLYSLPGFRYCDLLLGQAEPEDGAGLDGLAASREAVEWFREVMRRGEEGLKLAEQSRWLLDIALGHLTLGHAHNRFARTLSSQKERDAAAVAAAEHLSRAVDGLRQAGQDNYLPLGLLARAVYRRLHRDFDAAESDLTEVLEIAERGPMRLFECDAHLELFRLRRDQGRIEEALRHLERARALVAETGYLRREQEVEWRFGQPSEEATSTADPLQLAFHLVLAGYATPDLLQNIQGPELVEALGKAAQALGLRPDPVAVLQALEHQSPDTTPPSLWHAWMWETRGFSLRSIAGSLATANARRGSGAPMTGQRRSGEPVS